MANICICFFHLLIVLGKGQGINDSEFLHPVLPKHSKQSIFILFYLQLICYNIKYKLKHLTVLFLPFNPKYSISCSLAEEPDIIREARLKVLVTMYGESRLFQQNLKENGQLNSKAHLGLCFCFCDTGIKLPQVCIYLQKQQCQELNQLMR